MARPYKKGVDYFPLDVDIMRDPKLIEPKLKHGYLAFCVYIALLTMIYKNEGYYVDYSKKIEVLWGVSDLLQGKYQPEVGKIEEVIEDLVACGLFSRDHFDSKILTSKRLQATYYSATADRTSIDINWDIWCLSEEEMSEISKRSPILDKFIFRSKNSVNQSKNSVNRSENTQSKVNKSKVKLTEVSLSRGRASNEQTNDDNSELPNGDKDSAEIVKPTKEEVASYCKEKGYDINIDDFFGYNDARGWLVNGEPMASWKIAVYRWYRKEKQNVKANANEQKLKEPKREIGFDLDEFFNAALLKGDKNE